MDRIKLLKQYLEKEPLDDFLNYALALEYQKSNDLSATIEILTALLKRNPQYLAAYYQLGKTYEQAGLIENAIETYRQGKIIAQAQNDKKTLGELNEALLMLDVEE